MGFEYFIKVNNKYEKRIMTPVSGADRNFFKRFDLLLDEQIQVVRNDIKSFYPENVRVNLSLPSHEDYEVQKKINKLIKIRRLNLDTKEYLKSVLSENEFIICENCKSKMYKMPIGIKFERINNKITLLESPKVDTRYIYSCSNCNCMVDEICNNVKLQNIKLRDELLAQGKDFVPNAFGYWHIVK